MKAFLAFLKIDLKLAEAAKPRRPVLQLPFPSWLLFRFRLGLRRKTGRGGAVIVVTMVTVIGILGTGFFGAGMRSVQEREENILRRYKVTPITPVPLLLASIGHGVIPYNI